MVQGPNYKKPLEESINTVRELSDKVEKAASLRSQQRLKHVGENVEKLGSMLSEGVTLDARSAGVIASCVLNGLQAQLESSPFFMADFYGNVMSTVVGTIG